MNETKTAEKTKKLPARMTGFARYAWFVLAFNIGVVLWGAYVRATGSGAGCGSHWPLCNGEVVPQAPEVATLIEFAHRISSGLALLLVVGMFIWSRRAYPAGHPVRLGANLSMAFMISEALVGAALVLGEWVATDTSSFRVVIMGIHLVNTFLLLASLALSGWWASGGARLRLSGRGWMLWALGAGFLGVLLIGITGAVTALGDTLFPEATFADNFSSASHITIRLRVWHPVLAIGVGFYLIFISGLLGMLNDQKILRRFAVAFSILLVVQLAAGVVNLLLKAPVAMQIIHLFLADAVWITQVLFAATVFAEVPLELPEEVRETAPSPSGFQGAG